MTSCITPKAKQATTLTLLCLALIVYTLVIAKVFSPPGGPAADINQKRARCLNFSLSSFVVRPRVVLGSGFFPDPNDIRYWPRDGLVVWEAK